MTQQEFIETVQQLLPDFKETQIRLELNNAQQKFIDKTKLLSGATFTVTTIANQQYYDFSDFAGIAKNDDVLAVYQVDIDSDMIKRFQGSITDTDNT